MTDQQASRDFPELFKEMLWEWGPIRAQLELRDTSPPDNLIAHVRIVPFVGDTVVVVQMDDGHSDHPGGTLEPGETYIEAVERELQEEAGARLIKSVPFGVIHCFSGAPEPYRPHLPHPRFYHVVGFAEVELAGEPTNPPDGERIMEVERVSVEEAGRRFGDEAGAWLGELFQLADLIRKDEGCHGGA